MLDNQIGMQLHQKYFRGDTLTKQEEELLKIWYEENDKEDAKMLNVSSISKHAIDQLRIQISEVLNQLTQLTQSIQQLSNENDKIRQENARLFQRLIQKSESKAA